MKTVNVLSISGGKDSTAMWLYALETKPEGEILPVFADTGHEHPLTYEYVDYLERKLGPIKRVKADFTERIAKKREYIIKRWPEKLTKDVPGRWAVKADVEVIPEQPEFIPVIEYLYSEEKSLADPWYWIPEQKGMTEEEAQQAIDRALSVLYPTGNPFLDLCLWKGRFPSTKARFCTQFLKIIPIMEQVYMPILESGNRIVSWQGVRAQESTARAKLPEREDQPEGYQTYRPLLKWTVEDVFAIHKKHGIDPNPLYLQGMGRVGCMPCINCNKLELFEIARRFPEEIKRVAEWEELVSLASKRVAATFFPTAHGQGDGIYEWVEWSKTTYGGKQYDLLKAIEFENVPVCSSQYGLCE